MGDKGAIICAVVIVLILFIILGGPSRYFGYEKFAVVPAAAACAMCTKHPQGESCRVCRKRAGLERLSDIGACSTICDKWPSSQGCAACLNRQPPGSNQNLRGAVIGLLE